MPDHERLPVTKIIKFMLDFFELSEKSLPGSTNEIRSVVELPQVQPYTWIVKFLRTSVTSTTYYMECIIVQMTDPFNDDRPYLVHAHEKEIPLTDEEKAGHFDEFTGKPVL